MRQIDSAEAKVASKKRAKAKELETSSDKTFEKHKESFKSGSSLVPCLYLLFKTSFRQRFSTYLQVVLWCNNWEPGPSVTRRLKNNQRL